MADKYAENAALMDGSNGFDVVIVCTSTEKLAQYWQQRLEAGRGSILKRESIVLAVFEDWPGGAGNAFGTLYAWKKAVQEAQESGYPDIQAGLASGDFSCAIYHTAGKGTRLAPLPGSENNNKPGVKLPASLEPSDCSTAISILEAVIKQTGVYASSRKGRLSVFWGDQVFIPTASVTYAPMHHADILCTLGPMPSAEEWASQGLDKYGLIAVNGQGEAAQVEKVDHSTATRLLSSLGEVESVGTSLGSFSVSSRLLQCLMTEFQTEIDAKQGKLDTDPGLWMPMTLSCEAYVELMGQKGVDAGEATAHHGRMTGMKAKLSEGEAAALKLMGAVDVGKAAYWWDYGQLKLYLANNLKLTLSDEDQESAIMRSFYGIPAAPGITRVDASSTVGDAVALTGGSCLSHSLIRRTGTIDGSVLAGVRAEHVECQGAILVNVTAKRVVVAPGCVLYNVHSSSEEGIVVEEAGQVVTNVLMGESDGQIREITMRSRTDLDGGKKWKELVEGNEYTFEQIYQMNGEADVKALEAHSVALHNQVASTLGSA